MQMKWRLQWEGASLRRRVCTSSHSPGVEGGREQLIKDRPKPRSISLCGGEEVSGLCVATRKGLQHTDRGQQWAQIAPNVGCKGRRTQVAVLTALYRSTTLGQGGSRRPLSIDVGWYPVSCPQSTNAQAYRSLTLSSSDGAPSNQSPGLFTNVKSRERVK